MRRGAVADRDMRTIIKMMIVVITIHWDVGVVHTLSLEFTSAPDLINNSATAVLPFFTAVCNGVVPSCNL